MSSPRQFRPGLLVRSGLACALALAVAGASGCTVGPLYADAGIATASLSPAPAGLAKSVSIRPAASRVGLEVRNHLIFLLYGGAGLPAQADYSAELGVTSATSSVAVIQLTKDSEPTSSVVTMTSLYSITDNKTGAVVASGKRAVSSSYDIPRQEYAALRAERNAQDRSARELAELLRHAIAQDLKRLSGA